LPLHLACDRFIFEVFCNAIALTLPQQAIAKVSLAIAANPVKILTALPLQIIPIGTFVEFLPGKEAMIYFVAHQPILNVGLCQFSAKYI
jgi:hypothetical protein